LHYTLTGALIFLEEKKKKKKRKARKKKRKKDRRFTGLRPVICSDDLADVD